MIKKIIIIALLFSSLASCKWTDDNENDVKNNELNAKDVVIGGDKDENGCLGSAGYTWSKLNKECVRIFTGIQLLPVDKSENPDDAVYSVYILFNESGNKAELFLPNQDESVIVERKSKGKPWINGDWQLVSYNGYQLKKDGKLVYQGDGEIGNRVTGSDDHEEVEPTE